MDGELVMVVIIEYHLAHVTKPNTNIPNLVWMVLVVIIKKHMAHAKTQYLPIPNGRGNENCLIGGTGPRMDWGDRGCGRKEPYVCSKQICTGKMRYYLKIGVYHQI